MQGKVVPDEYDQRSYCLYDTDASTVYGVSAFLRRLRFLRAAALAGHCHRRQAVPVLRPRALLPRLRHHRIRPLLVRVLNPRPAPKPHIFFPSFFFV